MQYAIDITDHMIQPTVAATVCRRSLPSCDEDRLSTPFTSQVPPVPPVASCLEEGIRPALAASEDRLHPYWAEMESWVEAFLPAAETAFLAEASQHRAEETAGTAGYLALACQDRPGGEVGKGSLAAYWVDDLAL